MADEFTPPNPAPTLERRLATILCADVAGYSQLMGADEERTVQVFRGHREIFESLVNLHRGRIFNTAGDALLAEFNSAVEAVRCATEIQAALSTRNEHLAPGEKMLFRMGINLGDVIVQGGDLLGDGVNVAARIQTATEAGGICISGSVYDQIQNKLSLNFKLLGEQTYKNIAKPVRTYTISEGAAITTQVRRVPGKMFATVVAAALVIAAGGYWSYQQYAARRDDLARSEAQLKVQLAAQKQATEEAQRAAEAAKRDAQLQAQKLAAEETLRRAQEERSRLDQDKKLLEAERRAAEAAKKQADTSLAPSAGRTAPLPPPASKPELASAPTNAGLQDGTYNGQFCNHFKDGRPPACWPMLLVVRNGSADGSRPIGADKISTAKGTVGANGAFELTYASWSREGKPIEAVLAGRIADGLITTSGQWRTGGAISGSWKREQVVAGPAVVPKSTAQHDGTYNGQLCNHFKDGRAPECGSLVLVVRNGSADGTRFGGADKISTAKGTVGANGAFDLNYAGWTREGKPNEGVFAGKIADGLITVSGQWRLGGAVSGSFKREPLATGAAVAVKSAARQDGTYNGQLCNQFQDNRQPNCWPVGLVVRNGSAEGAWITLAKITFTVKGTVSANDELALTLTGSNGSEATLAGRIADEAITASGQWRNGTSVAGNWKRAR